MDYSAANTGLWDFFIWSGAIAALLLVANVLDRKVRFIHRTLIPVAALAGFILLALRSFRVLEVPVDLLEKITYHGIALGFIALALRSGKNDQGGRFAVKSGALIVGTYLMQAVLGLVISIVVAYFINPGFFKAAGILLPMAYGQGAGQANNVGYTYEQLGFTGGQTFGLSLAAVGYLVACLAGVWYTRKIVKKRGLDKRSPEIISGSITTEAFQDENEVPLTESVDRLSMQVALVLVTYLFTYLTTWGITSALEAGMPAVAQKLSPLLWGFTFITGSLIAMAVKGIIGRLRKTRLMTRQYQNNYLLNRISGLAFDLMIVAGISSINIGELKELLVPFLLMAVLGGLATFYFVRWLCRKAWPEFAEESFVAMYGMLVGTISSGILLLRQIDPLYDTPAANQLVVGSGTAIFLGAPMLLLIGIAPVSDAMLFLTLGLSAIYMALLILLILKWKDRKGNVHA